MAKVADLLGKIPEYQRKAEMHDKVSVTILEEVVKMSKKLEEINQKIDQILKKGEKP